MELRVLQYFLTVAREESISAAASALHLTQPTLSRQLRELEEELGKPLLIRGARKVTLTEEGRLLRKRAEEILRLVDKAETEVALSGDNVAGDIHIGAGETEGVRCLARAMTALRSRCPEVRYHISSGDELDVREALERGSIDFGLLFRWNGDRRYEELELPFRDRWGLLMRRDCPLAEKTALGPEDLQGVPLIVSRAVTEEAALERWLGRPLRDMDLAGTYSLLFNASLMVQEGLGCALCLDRIVNTDGESALCFRPLRDFPEAPMHVVWKRYQFRTRAAERFLEELRREAARG